MIATLATAAWATWPELSPPPPPLSPAKGDTAVVVAISDYAFVQDVPGADRNGRDWVAWLRQTRGVSGVRLLRDQQGTREAIAEAVVAAQGRTGPGGTLWFVFVGHGAADPKGAGPLLLGADVQPSASSIAHRGLPLEPLVDSLSNAIVIVDACFTGDSPSGRPLVPGSQPLIPTWALSPSRGTTVLAAAASDQVAGPLPRESRPAFSYLVLGALRGWGDLDGDRIVTAGEAVAYAGRVLFEAAPDRLQEPQLVGLDRSLASGSEPAPTWGAEVPARPPRPAPVVPAPRPPSPPTRPRPEASTPEASTPEAARPEAAVADVAPRPPTRLPMPTPVPPAAPSAGSPGAIAPPPDRPRRRPKIFPRLGKRAPDRVRPESPASSAQVTAAVSLVAAALAVLALWWTRFPGAEQDN